MPVEAHGIADTPGKYLRPCSVCFQTADKRVTIFVGFAYIARRPHWDIQQAVGTKSYKFPSVVAILWKLVVDCDRLRGIRKMGLDIIVPQYAIYFGDVERSIAKGNAVGHVQSLGDGKDFFGFGFAGLTYSRVHLALFKAADEQRTLRTQRQRPGIRHVAGINTDLKARRQRHDL